MTRDEPLIRIPGFEGTVSEAVRRAQVGELDLREVSVAEAIRSVLDALPEEDLEARTHFLQQAAMLVALKSLQLLPARPAPGVNVEEADAEAESPMEVNLEAYRAFRDVASALAALEAVQSRVFTRPPVEVDPSELPLVGVSVEDLLAAFRRVLERSREVVEEIPAAGVSVEERAAFILRTLAASPTGVVFEALFQPEDSRLVVIVTFLALLELVRQGRIRIEQSRPFTPIRLRLAESRSGPRLEEAG
ncbi:MAG: ScpA family protein [Armatimonadota bacterium]|nr:ScpA family protein [Armatimonadota bacterium]MDR7445214.1 ScpA family protein [Armatimonadota bacterium]MDR7615525.1 ScpA family protein [Armatimonadota bacterium]